MSTVPTTDGVAQMIAANQQHRLEQTRASLPAYSGTAKTLVADGETWTRHSGTVPEGADTVPAYGGGYWLNNGPIGALRARKGLNLLDYAKYKNGDDWAPALNRMIAEAIPGQHVTIPAGTYTIRSSWVIDKAVVIEGEEATLNATGEGFLPDTASPAFAQIPEFITGNPRPAIDIMSRTGTGSLGGVTDFGMRNIKGVLPNVERISNPSSNKMDGSVGVRLNNAYYPELTLGNIRNFQVGFLLDCYKSGSAVRGSSHGRFWLGFLANNQNVMLYGRKADTMPRNGNSGVRDPVPQSEQGWVTENAFYKGGFTTPDGVYNQSGNVPENCQHITVIGHDLGWNNKNVFYQPSCEGHARHAYVARGGMMGNGVEWGRYEMPYMDKAVKVLRDPAYTDSSGSGKPYALRFLGGYAPTLDTIYDEGLGTHLSLAQYAQQIEYVGKVAYVTAPAGTGSVTPGTAEMVMPHARANKYVLLNYTGTETSAAPLVVDVSKGRKFLIVIKAGVAVTAGSIQFANLPTLIAADVEVILSQAGTGATNIDPQWLKDFSVKYGPQPVPVPRANGNDVYVLTLKDLGAGTATEALVREYASRNHAGGSTALATTSAAGTVKKAAALTAAAPTAAAGTAPTKAEFDAVVNRLADLEAKLQAAGILT